MKYYDINPIREKGCDYNFIVSGRGPGKTTAAVNMLIDEYYDHGGQFVRIGRYDWEVSRTLMSCWFNAVNQERLCERSGDEYARMEFRSGEFRIYHGKDEYEVMGYIVTLNNQDVYKSTAYDRVTNIVFDEFAMLRQLDYMTGETTAFLSAVSTIARNRQDVRVWFIGNTLDKHNPYFDLFGIDVDRLGLKPGDLRTFRCGGFKGLGATVAVEFAEMSYEDISEMSPLMRISGNDTAVTGAYEVPPEVGEFAQRCALVPDNGWGPALPRMEGVYCGGDLFGTAEVSLRSAADGRPVLRIRDYCKPDPPFTRRWLNMSGLFRPTFTIDFPVASERPLDVVDPQVLYYDPTNFRQLQLASDLCVHAFEKDDYRFAWDTFIEPPEDD